MDGGALYARVCATNNANKRANELYPVLADIFHPLIGQKIEKADGTLLEKFNKLLPQFSRTANLHIYRFSSNHFLAWVVKACESDGAGYNFYCEAAVRIGEMNKGTLRQLLDMHQLRTDYTIEEVIQNRTRAEEAKNVYWAARDICYPFGEG